MSEKVSAFWPVHIGEFEYLFFIVNWNDYSFYGTIGCTHPDMLLDLWRPEFM